MKKTINLILAAGISILAACNNYPQYQYVLPVNGSNIVVSEENSSLKGLKISIPENAMQHPMNLVVKEIKPPEIENETFVSAGPAVEIKSGDSAVNFTGEVLVTLPLSAEITDIPLVGYYNQKTSKWEYIKPDTTNIREGEISFKTKHFSIFMPMLYKIGNLVETASEIRDVLGDDAEAIQNMKFTDGQMEKIITKLKAKQDEAYLNIKKMEADYNACKQRKSCEMFSDIDKMVKETSGQITGQITEELLEIVLKKTGGIMVVRTAFFIGDVIQSIILLDCINCFLPNSVVSSEFWKNYLQYMYYDALLKSLEGLNNEVYLAVTGTNFDNLLVHVLDFKYGYDGLVKGIYYSTSKSKNQEKLTITNSTENSWEVLFPNAKSVAKISKKKEGFTCKKPDGTELDFNTKSLAGVEWDGNITFDGTISNGGTDFGFMISILTIRLESGEEINLDEFPERIAGLEVLLAVKDGNGNKLNPKLLNKSVKVTYKLIATFPYDEEGNTYPCEIVWDILNIELIKENNKRDDSNNKSSGMGIGNTFTDTRDGKTYKTVKIGNQTWMAENLAFKASNGCWAYKNDQTNVKKYGYMYDWETAKKVCPAGWHLPTKEEFDTLLKNVGGSGKNAYNALLPDGNSGFSAPFGGWRYDNGSFNGIGEDSNFWSSAYNETVEWCMSISSDGKDAHMSISDKSNGFSVRCVQDN